MSLGRTFRAFWGKPVAEFGRKGSITIVLALVVYALVGSAAINRWDHRHGASVENLGFGYGALIRAIDETGAYRVCNVHHEGICFSAHRLPLIPFAMRLGAAVLGDDQARIATIKSLMMAALLAIMLLVVVHNSRLGVGWFLLGTVGLLTMPRWGVTFFELSVEEAYLSVPLALLVSLALFAPAAWWCRASAGVVTGVLLVTLLFLKNSMPYLCIAVPGLIWWQRRNTRPMTITLTFVVIGMTGLAWFNLMHAGRWTIGSSWEGWNLYKGNNPLTADYYPRFSLDLLDYENGVPFDRPITDEWDYDSYLKNKATKFIRAHPGEFIRLALIKAGVFLVDIRPNGAQRNEAGRADLIKTLQIGWMLAFRVLLWFVIFTGVRDLCRRQWRSPVFGAGLLYFGLLVLYGGFYVVGFAYERHVVPIMWPTLLFFWWKLTRARPVGAKAATIV